MDFLTTGKETMHFTKTMEHAENLVEKLSQELSDPNADPWRLFIRLHNWVNHDMTDCKDAWLSKNRKRQDDILDFYVRYNWGKRRCHWSYSDYYQYARICLNLDRQGKL